MNIRMMNTVPRKPRLATTTASTARPSWVGAIERFLFELRRLETSPGRSPAGSELVQSMMPTDSAANPASWLWTPSAGPFVR